MPPRLDRSRAVYLAASFTVLIPCFWQRRLEAGDLSSHIYNAWLAQLIEQGKANGLMLVRQSNNILFDWMLSGLLKMFGAGAAQRIAVATAVLVFFWGAFALVWAISGRQAPWSWTPALAMLAYGWVFHMGLFNFYLALGLVCWALALALAARFRTDAWRWPVIVALLGVSYVAHPLPMVWAIAVLAYSGISRGISPQSRFPLACASLVGLALASALARKFLQCAWSSDQATALSGADQLWVFSYRYLPLSVALLAIWAAAMLDIIARRGLPHVFADTWLHLYVLTAAGVVLVPGAIVISGKAAESLLIGRMSLAAAILCCGVAATVPMRKWLRAALTAVAAIFFVFIYQDESALNRVEDRMERAVAQLPPGQRVVSALMDTNQRVFSLLHLIDRVCIGRCFSYANYEPSVGQFRVRAVRENNIVTADFHDSWAMQAGGYVVKPRDLPLYRIDLCVPGRQDLCVAPVAPGVTLQSTRLHVTPDLWLP